MSDTLPPLEQLIVALLRAQPGLIPDAVVQVEFLEFRHAEGVA